MSVADGARRHPVLSAVVALYIAGWLVYGLVAANVDGYENTGRDLVANLLGTATAGWWVSRRPWDYAVA